VCGIAGALSWGGGPPPDLALLRKMVGRLHHRGPDERGIYRDNHVGLGHTRLSIIDLSTGQQPLSNEDRTIWTVFNGEIFNYVELRDELRAAGHVFRTQSDTEVIVHGYEQWGTDVFERFNGQWAIALWDSVKRRLVLSRDRLGVRPIYLARTPQALLFASEVKALMAHPDVPRELDPAGLDDTFTFWAPPQPRTVFRGVEELEPGAFAVVEAGSHWLGLGSSWTPRYEPPEADAEPTIADSTARVEAALERAVKLRLLRADVPVGAYLSGGLDSSLIAALCRRWKSGVFKTFSLRFADRELDESVFQQAMVDFVKSDHDAVTVTGADVGAALPDVITFAEKPLLRLGPAPMMLLSRRVRAAGFKVVLTGEGADEMFGGYDLFREAKVRRFWSRQPHSKLRPRLIKRLYPYLARSPAAQQKLALEFFGQGIEAPDAPDFSHQPRWRTARAALTRLYSPELKAALGTRDAVAEEMARLPREFARWEPLARAQWLEVRTLLGSYLLSSQGDRMLMASSVEGRFPFLDKDVVELANNLPPTHKLNVLDEKHVLKQLARGLVPQSIIDRPKQPYRAPDAPSLFGPGAPSWVGDVLSEAAVRAAGVFLPQAVTRMAEKCRKAAGQGMSNSDNMAAVAVVTTQLLHAQLASGLAPPQLGPDSIETLVDLGG